MIEKLIGYGASYIRTHVNIDPYVELENFWGVKRALEKYAHVIDYDIVVFPQHGLLKSPNGFTHERSSKKWWNNGWWFRSCRH